MLKGTTVSFYCPNFGRPPGSAHLAKRVVQTARKVVRGALPALLLVSVACEQGGQMDEEVQESIEPQEQAYGANITTDANKARGHAFIMLKALQYLRDRQLLPAELQDINAASNLVFGVNFADDTWLGRPSQYNDNTPAYIWNPLDDERWLDKYKSGTNIHDWVTFYGFSPDKVNECGWAGIDLKYQLSVDQRMVFAQGTSARSNNLSDYLVKKPEDDRPATFHRTCFKIQAGYLGEHNEKVACNTTDNMFHYPLGESDLELTNTGNISSDAKIYPLNKNEFSPNWYDGFAKDCAANKLRNLPVVTGSKIGLSKYGSILYQLSRRFFDNNTNWPAPDINQLIKAGNGNDIPSEWKNGWFELNTNIFSQFAFSANLLPPSSLKNMPSDRDQNGNRIRGFFPHTYLGGNPFICTGGDNVMRDTCATGSPTWPVWVPKEDYSPATKDIFNARLSARFPERSNQAAQIYLGWAAHMIQDSNLPQHAANWSSFEHENQDGAIFDTVSHDGHFYTCNHGTAGNGPYYPSTHICVTAPRQCTIPGYPPTTSLCCDNGVSPMYDRCLYPAQKVALRFDDLPEVRDVLESANFPKSASDVDSWCNSMGITDASLNADYINYKASYNLYKEAVLRGRNLAAKQVNGRVFPEGLTPDNGLDPNRVKYFSTIMANAMVDTMKLLICAPPRKAKALLIGTRCQEDKQCDSGFCTDGVCCNERCSGVCRSCNQPTARSLGYCLALRDGERDPLCPDSNSGYTGLCDGNFSCSQLVALPGAATSPSPANGATGISVAGVTLKWTAGTGAITHDVYFGTSSSTAQLIGTAPTTVYSPSNLNPNTTYSWYIIEKNSRGQTQSSTWSFTTAGALPGIASKPSPAQDATGISTSTVLKWTAGAGATSHDVYLGTSAYGMELVSSQPGTSFTPKLEPNTKYYWAITEVNSGGETPGDAWQFTTAAVVVPLPGAARSPSPANGATGISIAGVTLKWTAGTGAITHDVYFGTSSSTAKLISTAPTAVYSPGDLKPNTTYSWYIIEKNSRGQTKSSTWSFTTAGALPGVASKPSPADEATGISTSTVLKWTAGLGATSHDVYLGTSAYGLELVSSQSGTSYTPKLQPKTKYYWSITEKNSGGETPGDAWQFTTK